MTETQRIYNTKEPTLRISTQRGRQDIRKMWVVMEKRQKNVGVILGENYTKLIY